MLKRIIAAIVAAVIPTFAAAQSNPGLVRGQVPAPAQWNSYFSAKQDVLGYTPLNRAGDAMQGRLGTTASTTAAAGLNLPAGSAPTSPVDGDMWTTTGGVFARINGGTVGPFTSTASGAAGAATQVQFNATGTDFGASANLTWVSPALSIGAALGSTGQLKIAGTTSGAATITVPDAAGTPTITLGSSSGTPAVTASAPLALSTTTGNLTVTGAAGQVLAGATPAFTATPTLGASGTLGSLTLGNATSGLLTLQPVTGALGTVTLGLPAATDTLVARDTTDTLTNKTLTSPAISGGTINGAAIGGVTPAAGAFTTLSATSPLPLTSGGTGQATALAARAVSGLNVESLASVGDEDHVIAATERVVVTTTALSTPRTYTLPAANAINPGQSVYVADMAGGVTGVNTLTVQRAGADTVNGATSITIDAGNGAYLFISDGTSKWTAQALGASASAGVSSFNGRSGAVTFQTGDANAAQITDNVYGFRNRLINPSGRVFQRVLTGAAAVTDAVYDFDRWYGLVQSAGITASQLTNVENGTPFMMRLSQANATPQRFGRAQVIEAANAIDLRGSAVTLSARVRMSAATTLRYAILEWTSTADSPTKDVVLDWTSATFTAGNFFLASNLTVTATGSTALSANTLTTVTLTGTVGSSMNNLYVFFWTDSTQAQNVTLDIGKVQLEAGSSATPLAYRSLQTELLMCQRYYFKTFPQATAPAQNAGAGGAIFFMAVVVSSDNNKAIVNYPVTMRIIPTITLYNPSAANALARNISGSTDSTSLTTQDNSDRTTWFSMTGTSGAAWAAGNLIGFHLVANAEL